MTILSNYKNRVITTPRGVNLGENIKNDLIKAGLYNIIDIKTINTAFDRITKDKVTTVEYTFLKSIQS